MRDSWFKCDPQDFLDGIETCESTGQALVYVAAVLRIYASGGPVANNPRAFAVHAHVTPQWAARHVARLVEMGKLDEGEDGRLFNHRAAGELAARADLSAKRSRASKGHGRPKKAALGDLLEARTTRMRPVSDANANGMRPVSDQNANDLQMEETAEMRGDGKTNDFHARAREREREKETPTPPKRSKPRMPLALPDFTDDPADPSERLRLVQATDVADHGEPLEIDIAQLTGRIMSEARMTAPPSDLILVESWVRLGAVPETDIIPTVIRLAATARTPPRAMRYFDAEIRRIVSARGAEEAAQIAKFQQIATRARD